MPQSLTQIWLHIVFSTKERRPFLDNDQIRNEMHAYLAKICDNLGCPSAKTGGTGDHVHILCLLNKTTPCADLIKEIKRPSSTWAKTKHPNLATFAWQNGYGAFSVSQSAVPDVKQYIERQPEHHKTMTFQDEFRKLLEFHGIEYNERYLWD